MTDRMSNRKLPSLDGWRAVSIALVLLCHSTFTAGFPAKTDSAMFHFSEAVGIWGVRFFFVISGFLITHLLLQERAKNGRICLKNFYLRRAIRILPVCFFYLLVLAFFTHYSQGGLVWLANFTFTTNLMTILHPIATGHLWSLGVEEQFYLIWPFLMVFILNRANGVSELSKILVLPIVVAPAVRMLHFEHLYPSALQFLFIDASFFSKFDSLAYGCLSAMVFNFRKRPLEIICGKRLLLCCFGVLLVLLPWFWPFHGRFNAASVDSVQAIGFSLLLLQSILHPTYAFYRFLNWKWVIQIGVLSYSIYIWQQMFCGTGETVFGSKNAWWVTFPAWIFATLLAASASYYVLEKPLLSLRTKLRAK